MITEEYVRDYEISLWDLLDNFITVLKPMLQDTLGTILEPKMSLVDDGTQELTFSIPMYIVKEDKDKIENPIWYNTINGNLIADMRKLKVIFNKATSDEEVFEFLITKVLDDHDSEQINCKITSEGLAFHELGKQGYKIALLSENFETVYEAWEKSQNGEEPIANLLFWNEEKGLGLLPYPGDNVPLDSNIWYYEIQMDWSSYSYSHLRNSNKIYEEEYVTAWTIHNGIATPKENSIKSIEEKARIVDLTESNYYNLTLDLAKAFGVFCKYKYNYDDNYHIIGRRVIYYNNFIREADGPIDFTYPYSSSAISREMDGTDLVTKMYVKTVEDDSTPEGFISIMGTEANLSGEDYILNFEYMKKIGAINDDLYAEIKKYEAQMGYYNKLLVDIDNKLNSYELEKPKLEAAKTLAEAGIKAAENGRDENAALRENLDLRDEVLDGYITSPTRVMRLTAAGDGTYILKLSEKGILFSSLLIYTSYDFSKNEGNDNDLLTITESQVHTDEFGNLDRIEDIHLPVDATIQVYVSYKYSPDLYYERIINTWNIRLAKDLAKLASTTAALATLNTAIELQKGEKDRILKEKEEILTAFNQLMGPALREGKWTPENYKNCENKVTETLEIGSNDTNLIWDLNLFDGEQESSYKLGITEDPVYYPYVEINQNIASFLQLDLDKICLIYYDYTLGDGETYDIKKSRRIMLNGGLLLVYKYNNGDTPIPILMLTAAKNMSDLEMSWLRSTNQLVKLTISEEGNTLVYDVEKYNNGSAISFTTTNTAYNLVNLRYKINTLSIKTGETYLYVHLGDTLLKEYYDYSTLVKDGQFYITIKPSVIFNSEDDLVSVTYTLSNASTAIYLDAKEVLKENAIPRVSYTIESCVLNKAFMHNAYTRLNNIININDYDLKFENVLGYISSLNLDLDKPWQDTIEVKNYKTKFEDLFTSIVAASELMLKNANTYYSVSQVLNPDGTFKASSLLNGLSNIDLSYAFNNGTLSITNENGIWGISENGVVAMRGGGIFTATDKDKNGNWIWNTGITPQGINALLITTGLLDTNRVVIYAGDEVKFLLNDKGLFAYKSYVNDSNVQLYITALEQQLAEEASEIVEEQVSEELISEEQTSDEGENGVTSLLEPAIWESDSARNEYLSSLNKSLYVVYNSEGLFLHVDEGANVLDIIRDPTDFDTIISVNMVEAPHTVDRVEISWEGLILRDWNNKAVFYADHEGNLNLEGTIYAASGNIAGWTINPHNLATTNMTISSEDGINFHNRFAVNESGYITITSGNTIFKATSDTIGFYNLLSAVLTLTGSSLNVNGSFNMNATGNLTLSTSNLYINSNITLNDLPTDTTNLEPIDEYYNIYTLGNNLLDASLANRVSHIQYSRHRKIEYLEVESEPSEEPGEQEAEYEWQVTEDNYIFSIGDKFTYIFNNNSSSLNITGDLNATTLIVGENNSVAMSYSSGNGLLIGDTTSSYLQYNNSGLTIKGALTATSLTIGINGNFMKYNGSELNIGNNGLVYKNGTLSVTGNITANSLTIGTSGNIMNYNGTNLYIGSSSGGTYIKYGPENGSNKLSIQIDSLTLNGGSLLFASSGVASGIALSVDSGILSIWGAGSGNNRAHISVGTNSCDIATSSTVGIATDRITINGTTSTTIIGKNTLLGFANNSISFSVGTDNEVLSLDTSGVAIPSGKTLYIGDKTLADYIRSIVNPS